MARCLPRILTRVAFLAGLALALAASPAQAGGQPPVDVDPFDDAEAEYLAVSVLGDARAQGAMSVLGDAHGCSLGFQCTAVSGTGTAAAGDCSFFFCTGTALGGTGRSEGGLVAGQVFGDSDGFYAASVTGAAKGQRAAASVTGPAEAGNGPAVSACNLVDLLCVDPL